MKVCSHQEASTVEDHLLVCQRCRSSFEGAKEFVGLVKRAFSGNRPGQPVRAVPVEGTRMGPGALPVSNGPVLRHDVMKNS
jgi:hypothetical protein